MTSFSYKDFSDWHEYDGASEGSGRSEKIWLESANGEIGLFKYPKTDAAGHISSTEHVSEHLAHQLGKVLGVETAKVDLGQRDGRIGCMSYLVNAENEQLLEGVQFISKRHPKFDVETLYDAEDEQYYSISHILEVGAILPLRVWIEMMLFDFVIGNTDRHQSNWAIIAHLDRDQENGQRKLRIRRSPLYDNGSSLCAYESEEKIDRFFSADKRPFDSLVGTKSLSIIRIDGKIRKKPTHEAVVRYLIERFPEAVKVSKLFLSRLDENIIDSIMDKYPEDVLSHKKNLLIRKYLKRKMSLLNEILEGSESNAEN